MSPFEMIREHMSKAVPFATHTGLEIVSIGEGACTAALDQRPETSNHIGSQHAGALFTLGEAASGGAMSGALVTRILSLRPVAADASIRYTRIAKGRITARAETSKSSDVLLKALDDEGKVAFDVNVTMTDAEGQTVAEMTVKWHVRQG